ncbi:MAG: hypothetical protein RLZ77_894 [Bacteroidota bacterium]
MIWRKLIPRRFHWFVGEVLKIWEIGFSFLFYCNNWFGIQQCTKSKILFLICIFYNLNLSSKFNFDCIFFP